jgi:hypothetical protein
MASYVPDRKDGGTVKKNGMRRFGIVALAVLTATVLFATPAFAADRCWSGQEYQTKEDDRGTHHLVTFRVPEEASEWSDQGKWYVKKPRGFPFSASLSNGIPSNDGYAQVTFRWGSDKRWLKWANKIPVLWPASSWKICVKR